MIRYWFYITAGVLFVVCLVGAAGFWGEKVALLTGAALIGFGFGLFLVWFTNYLDSRLDGL